MQKEKYKIELNKNEYDFITYCRKVKFCEMKLIIQNGKPARAYKTVKSIKFGIDKAYD